MANKAMIGSLTSLRFFAASAIVLQHARGMVLPNEFMSGVPLAAGVSFFFVLSGFILSYVYCGKIESVGLYKFYTSRLSKIWPAHIFTMVLVMVLLPRVDWSLGAPIFWLVVLLNGTLLQSIVPIPAYYFSFNGVSWSISTELFFYAAFPFLLSSLNKTWHIKLICLLFLGGVTAYLFDSFGSNYYSPEKFGKFSGHGLTYISPICRIQEFFIGMLSFKVFNFIKDRPIFGVMLCAVLEVLCVVSVLLWTRNVIESPQVLFGPGKGASVEFWSNCITGVFFGLIVVCYALNKGPISIILRQRLLVLLGEISFSMYMIHQVVFRVYNRHRLELDFLPSDAIFPLLLLVVLLLSYGIWKFIELPAQARLKIMFSSFSLRRDRHRTAELT